MPRAPRKLPLTIESRQPVYTPKMFRETDLPTIHRAIDADSFGTWIVASGAGKLDIGDLDPSFRDELLTEIAGLSLPAHPKIASASSTP